MNHWPNRRRPASEFSVMIGDEQRLIRNGGSALNQTTRRLCLRALEVALSAINPFQCLKSRVSLQNEQLTCDNFSISLSRFRRIMLLAVGKASVPMMGAAVDLLEGWPIYGILVGPKGQGPRNFDRRIEIFRSGHPVPDRDGLEASNRVCQVLSAMQEDELLLCLISGGASAMLPAPAVGISLEDKRRVTEELLRKRATIHEINTVRRHLSKLKGGRLVEVCSASKILSLIISDVPGNPLADIASGLTVEDHTTYQDAVEVVRRHGLWPKIPDRVRSHLAKGLRGELPETPKPGNPSFRRTRNLIIADNRTACTAAKHALEASGTSAMVLTSAAEMEARTMGKLLASAAIEHERYEEPRNEALIVGGETTVEVKGKGIGGRNQETLLSAVDDVSDLEGTVIAALATDGIDGNSKAAGAIIDGNTARRAKRKGMSAGGFLIRNDSYRFFKQLNDNLYTGPTRTNVGDLYLVLCCQ